MDERKPQPAWRQGSQQRDSRGGQQQQQSRGPQGDRPCGGGYQRDDSRRNPRDRDNRPDRQPLPEMRAPVMGPLEVEVFRNDVVQALRVLKMKVSKEGILADLKRHRHAEKPGEARRHKHREALKRARKSKGRGRKQGFSFRDRSKVVSSVPIPIGAVVAPELPTERTDG